MKSLNKEIYRNYETYPEKVLQFGEGNFLRGFVDWQIQVLNEEADFNGSVVVVQPRGSEKIERLNKQDGLYTLYLQGMKDEQEVDEHLVIHSISRGINLNADYDAYMELAASQDLRFVVSNTTEAGIVFNPEDKLEDRPQSTFPGKLAAFLYYRYKAFKGDESKGCIIIPCELVEDNGGKVKEAILQYAAHWNLEEGFVNWIHEANTFCSSLVDRIVPGFPKDSYQEKTEQLGYLDELMVTGEQYHLWVIEGPAWVKDELPFEKTKLNAKIVDDLTPYRTRKVRILNGTHTAMTPVAYLCGLDSVADAVNHKEVGAFVRELIAEEILPTLEGSAEELNTFAIDVLDRFKNPYIKHYLMSISLNSISKFRTRDLPTLLEYVNRRKAVPKRMTFSLSALIYFYKGNRNGEKIELQDDQENLQFFSNLWEKYNREEIAIKELARTTLAEESLWGLDLTSIPQLEQTVTAYLEDMEQLGMQRALKELTGASIK
ncbi:tagaturonate reductase [Mesobacillus foraminis]|uniref:tagaturonate reductase n=1 Tax=Mesobacillus foraminis TaxID=279826 RepID=UPI0039A3C317